MIDQMRPVHRRDVIRGVRDRWLAQYSHYPDGDSFRWCDRTAGEIRRRLRGLDLETCSESDVDDALGVSGWAANDCDICNRNVPVLLRIGAEPDYEARWQDMCADCLSAATAILNATEPQK